MIDRIQVDWDQIDVASNIQFAATICAAISRAGLNPPRFNRTENPLYTVCYYVRDALGLKGCHLIRAGNLVQTGLLQGSVIFFKPNK